MRNRHRPEQVVQAAPRRHLRTSLQELWAFRETIRAFAERDIRVKYKQAALGIGWSLIQPLAFMAVFAFTLGHLAGVSGGSVPYAAFSLSALVPWTFLSTAVSFGANALLADVVMVRRVYFPREVPILASVVSASVDFAIGLCSSWWSARSSVPTCHHGGSWRLSYLRSWQRLRFVATPLAALNVYYRDFRFALPFAIQLWLFASPVAYPVSAVSSQWRSLYVTLNPAAGILDSFSRVLANGTAPDASYLGLSLIGTVVVGGLGYYMFKRLEPTFADVI